MAEASPARRLLEQIERSSRNAEEPLGEFSDEAMSQLKAECAKLYSEVLRLMDGGDARVADLPDATKASLVVHHQRVLRNKECALFYLRERLEVLTRLRCEAGSNLPRNVRRHCSPQESQFNAAYDQLYQDFCRASRLDPRDSLKPPRDLYVEVRVREHDIFQRDGDDLHCEVPIRISQAALGDTVRVPTLKGEAEIRIPAETQTGKLFRLRGKGVKSVRSRSEGDLYCRVVVETPVNLTPEQRELLEKFEATFIGEEARKHSPKSATFLDGVKGFWDRMTS